MTARQYNKRRNQIKESHSIFIEKDYTLLFDDSSKLPIAKFLYSFVLLHFMSFLCYKRICFSNISYTYCSLENRITVSVRELGDLLLSIKGGGQVTLNQPSQRNAVAAEADEVLRPLMDLLDGTYS
jgi:hypothetical protein